MFGRLRTKVEETMISDNSRKEIETNSNKSLDDSIHRNAENANGAGLEVRVTRTYDGVGLSNGRVCQWCLDRCGDNMTLQEAYDKQAFQRHDGCGCIIEYVSARGERTYQTGKSSPQNWLSDKEFEKRVNYGLNDRQLTPQERIINAAIEMQARDKRSLTLVNAINDNHEALRYYTPDEMKQRLERAGYKVEPLGNRSKHVPGKPFNEGGGYRVIFGGDGYLQYHPAGGRHKIEYWKISNGERKVHKYDMAGKELFF